jgi:hypothetical protein
LVAACREVGLHVESASARLVDGDSRVVYVTASPERWAHELSLISLIAIIDTNGQWSETVDIQSAPATEERESLNPPYSVCGIYMSGRKRVPIGDVANEILETISEREQVIAAVKCGVSEPFEFEKAIWKSFASSGSD